MSWVMVDVETGGRQYPTTLSTSGGLTGTRIPANGITEFAAIVCREPLIAFYGAIDRIERKASSENKFEEITVVQQSQPVYTMQQFALWLSKHCNGNPKFISDNNGFDWQFINVYFHECMRSNPFGHSSQNLGSLYKGLVRSTKKNFKHLRKTPHTHHPLDDALGNVEALFHMVNTMGLEMELI